MAAIEKLMDVDEVSDLLGLSKKTIWKLCREKKIPHHRFGREYRFSQGDFREILASSRVEADDSLPTPVGAR